MKQRIATASVLLVLLAAVLFSSGTMAFPLFAAVFAASAVYEMLRCLGTHKNLFLSVPAIFLAALSPLALLFFAPLGENFALLPLPERERLLYLLTLFAAFTLFTLYAFGVALFTRKKQTFSRLAASVLTTLYVTLSFSSIPLLRFMENGQYYYLLCFIGPWVTDTFAYFTGYFFGKHKLIPSVSPKKTVEGSIGGIVFCLLSFFLFGFFVSKATGTVPNYLVLLLLGAVVSVLSQIGDLFASLIKRENDKKDYGKLFPGHGGVMDRFDSVLASTPLLLIVCTLDSLLSYQLLL